MKSARIAPAWLAIGCCVAACGSGESPSPSGAGGAAGLGGGNGVGGIIAAYGGQASFTGGNVSAGGSSTGNGGISSGASANGGTASGGKATGGMASGGTEKGGTTFGAGGITNGGTSAGGVAAGGKAAGGASLAVGGKAAGGAASGGVAAGGKAAGGAASSGAAAGGKAAGGTAAGGATAVGGGSSCALPTSFKWSSTGPIIAPISDSTHDLVAIKDPSVVLFNGRWHVYASSVAKGGVYGMVYLSFTDFNSVSSGTFYYMDKTAGFNTYVAAPQVFYFAPQNKWYLVFQSGPPMYSTNDDPSKPENWTRPAAFYAKEPAIITQNGGWLDYWVICDDTQCYLFFSDDHGRWYRSATNIGSFPNGFGDPTIVMQDAEAGRLFEASNVYKIKGSNQYLALIEAYDSTSNWRRYFRSWTATSLGGPWVPLKDSGTAPFAGTSNTSFTGQAWTSDISHGEAIRAGYDQTMTLDPCDLRYLYQDRDPNVQTTDYNAIPWRLGLLTYTPN